MLVSGVLLFSLVLLRVPTALGEEPSPIVSVLTLLPFLAAIGSLAWLKGRWRAAPPALLAVLYVLLLVVAALRASYFETIPANDAVFQAIRIVLIATLACFAFLREPRPEARRRYVVALCWAPVVFVAVNVVLHLVGYVPSGQASSTGLEATILSALGVSVERVSFPMSGGVNGIAPTAAVGFAVCATFAVLGQRRKLALLPAALSLYALLLTDSRGALLAGLLAAALVVFTRRRRRRFGWVAIALPVLPALVAVSLGALEDTPVAARLDRSGASSISQGTGRTAVWEATWTELSEPKLDHIFGYGQKGQVASNVSVSYASLFQDDIDASAHSVILQTLLDLGWFGFLCLLALAASVIRRLTWWARREPVYAALLAGTLAVLFVGTLEATPTPAHLDSWAWWVMVVFAATRARDQMTPRQNQIDEPRSFSSKQAAALASPSA